MAKNDVAAEIAKNNDAADDYTWGLHNRSLTSMILLTLLYVPLAAVLLCRLPAEPAPATGPGPTLEQSVPIVWTVSLLVCSYLSFWIYTFSPTMGAAAVFLRVSYPAALAYTAAGIAGPAAGVAAAHLATAWTAGQLGYALAKHRMRDGGGERAAGEAAAASSGDDGRRRAASLCYVVFASTLMTLLLAAIAVWLAFFLPGEDGTGGEQDDDGTCANLGMLSMLACWILYSWAFVVSQCFLHGALVSGDFMMNVGSCYAGFILFSVLFLLVSLWLWVYYFALEKMAMAAFFGYTLAVNARCKEILARDQPLQKDLELGDVVKESASAST